MDCCLCLLTTVYWLTVISSCFAVLGTGTFQRMHAYGKLRVVADQTRADVRPVGPEEKVSLLRQVNKLVLFVEKMTVPKKWFTHFYVVANFWNGLFVVSTFLSYASYTDDQNDKYITIFSLVRILSSPFLGGYCTDITPITLHDVSSKPLPPLVDLFDVLFPLLQVQIHVAFRLYECLYVSKSSLNGRMHIFGYLIGLSFYLAVPWTIVVDTFLWRESEEALATGYGTNEKRSFYFYDICTYLASLCVFVYASHQQKKAHKILAELRAEQNCQRDIKRLYKIPFGGWFEQLSCPHYLFEIIIYLQLILVTGPKLNCVLLVMFVFLNLTVTATKTHRWYQAKFKEYPPERKAVIPYIL